MSDNNVRPWYGRLTVWLLDNVVPPVIVVVLFVVFAIAVYREWIIWNR